MRTSLYIIVLAILWIGVPSSAFALDVRPAPDAEQAVQTYQSDTVSFEYVDGELISHQSFKRKSGRVEQITIRFTDADGASLHNEAFVAVQLYDHPPAVEGVTDPREAITKALMQSLSARLGETLDPEPMRANFGGLGEIKGVQAKTAAGANQRYLAFFVKPLDAGGYAVIFMQLRADDGATRHRILDILKSMSFGGA